jgi:hypothetical protein
MSSREHIPAIVRMWEDHLAAIKKELGEMDIRKEDKLGVWIYLMNHIAATTYREGHKHEQRIEAKTAEETGTVSE